jgi:hypothetical protein
MIEDKMASRRAIENKTIIFQKSDDLAWPKSRELSPYRITSSICDTPIKLRRRFLSGVFQIQGCYQGFVVGGNRFLVLLEAF